MKLYNYLFLIIPLFTIDITELNASAEQDEPNFDTIATRLKNNSKQSNANQASKTAMKKQIGSKYSAFSSSSSSKKYCSRTRPFENSDSDLTDSDDEKEARPLYHNESAVVIAREINIYRQTHSRLTPLEEALAQERHVPQHLVSEEGAEP